MRACWIAGLALLGCQDRDKAEDTATSCEIVGPSLDRVDKATGYRSIERSVEAPWLEEARTIPVGVWYPTEETEGEAAVYIEVLKDEEALVDATFADPAPGCKMPLVVYSHGSQAWGGNASPLVRHLVAQGWVAAAPDHVGNTLFDNVDPRPVSFSLTRVADIQATIDLLEDLPAEDPLHGRVDTSRVLVLGHSFGGQTAWLFSGPTFDTDEIAARCDAGEPGCSEAERAAFETPVLDERVVGVLPMDGFAGSDLVAEDGWASATLPILYLSKAEDGDDEPITRAAEADVTWARFDGACHETFTVTAVNCPGFEKEEGLDVVATYLSAYAAQRVLGLVEEPYAGVLDGSTVVDARVTVTRTAE